MWASWTMRARMGGGSGTLDLTVEPSQGVVRLNRRNISEGKCPLHNPGDISLSTRILPVAIRGHEVYTIGTVNNWRAHQRAVGNAESCWGLCTFVQ